MNLVEQIVAENRQSVTSQELAKAAGMTHEELCQLFNKERYSLKKNGPIIGNDQIGYTLTITQVFALVLMMEMSDAFYEEGGQPTPEDDMKADLKASFVLVFMIMLKAHEKRTGEHIDPLKMFFEKTGVNIVEVMEEENNGQ